MVALVAATPIISNTMPSPIKKNSTANDRTVPALLSASFEIYDMTTDSTKLITMIVTTHRTLTAEGFCGGFFFCLLSVVSNAVFSFGLFPAAA